MATGRQPQREIKPTPGIVTIFYLALFYSLQKKLSNYHSCHLRKNRIFKQSSKIETLQHFKNLILDTFASNYIPSSILLANGRQVNALLRGEVIAKSIGNASKLLSTVLDALEAPVGPEPVASLVKAIGHEQWI